MGRVVVRLDARTLNKGVAAVEEFADVSPQILHQEELAARVQLLVPVQIEHEVVENEERDSSSHALVNLIGRVHHELSVLLIGRLHNHLRLAVRASVAEFTEQHQHTKRHQTDQTQRHH